VETTGAIYSECIDFLKSAARIGSDRNHINYCTFYNYMIKQISCFVQKSFTCNITQKLSKILIPSGIREYISNNINDNVGINVFDTNPHFNIAYF
jgi:hypothetical protein